MSHVPSPPAAKAALLALMRAEPALSGVQVEWSHPGADLIEPECVYLGDVNVDERAKVLGNRRRDESYALEVVVTVELPGMTPQEVEQRCWTLVGGVRAAVDDNETLGLDGPDTNVIVAQIETERMSNFPATEAHVSECLVHVRVNARI